MQKSLLSSPLAAAALAVSLTGASACDYAVDTLEGTTTQTVEREESGEASWNVGELNADCSDTDADDGVTYVHRTDGEFQYCLVVMDWDSLMIDMVEVRNEVEASVDEAAPGAGENTQVEFTDFTVKELSIELVKETDDGEVTTLPFDAINYYLATLNVQNVNDVVAVDWPIPGEPSPASDPRVTFSSADDPEARQALLDFLNAAYQSGDKVDTVGHAELEFRYTDPEELLALSGSRLEVDFTLAITGEGSYDLGNSFDNPGN